MYNYSHFNYSYLPVTDEMWVQKDRMGDAIHAVAENAPTSKLHSSNSVDL